MMKKALVLGFMIFLGGAGFVRAEEQPVQLALFNPIQIFSEEDSIQYFRWNFIYGVNADVRGLDIGLVNQTTGSQRGLQSGLVNVTQEFHGWQNGFVNSNEGSDKSIGLQTGFISYVNGDFSGLQWGTFNIVKGEYHGTQVGLFNSAGDLHGLQVGFINYADSISEGVQIGLANVNEAKDPFWILPFVNGKF
jgi:hypothetical protein